MLRSDAVSGKIIRPEGCICIQFRDTGGFRIADLTCPVHGVGGTEPGDGYWETAAEPSPPPPGDTAAGEQR